MLGERPITLADTTVYVSHQDPAVDWDRIVERELERFPELADKAKVELAQARMRDVYANESAVRTEVVQQAFAERLAVRAQRDPSSTVEELVAKAGSRVTRFVIGVVPPAELARINDEAKAFTPEAKRQELFWRTFLASVRRIEEWGGTGTIPTRKVGDVEYVDPVWLRETFVGPRRSIGLEVGRVSWFWNQFSEDDAKK